MAFRRFHSLALSLFAANLALIAGPTSSSARADLIISVQSVTVEPGATNQAFDVLLANTGPNAVSIGGFSLGLTTASAIAFTEANISTATPYIFAGNSAFGPIISTTPPPSGSNLLASDQFLAGGSGISLASGATVGLAHVVFNATSAGVYTVGIVGFPTTSLSGFTGGNIPITTLVNGTITVASVAVPEPSTVMLLGLALPIVALAAARGRLFGRAPSNG